MKKKKKISKSTENNVFVLLTNQFSVRSKLSLAEQNS